MSRLEMALFLGPYICCDSNVPVSPARRIAYDVLHRVEADAAYASDELHAQLGDKVSSADAALATELTMGVLRWRGLLDFLLQLVSDKPMARLDLPVAIALRLGLYQMRFLEKIPARAAVNESVELVKRAKKTSAAPFVNAVLRKATAKNHVPPSMFVLESASLAERLAILHSHPQWLVERWLARFGWSSTIALLEANNKTPRLTCALSDPHARDAVFQELSSAGLRVEPGRLLSSAFSVTGGSPSRTAAFREGRISIQDEASQAVALLLPMKPADHVLDVCAAPGGKTAILARELHRDGRITAADRYAHRLRAVRAQIARLKLADVDLVELDAKKPLPFGRQFEKILVDAPCTGTGTLARHPEIRWRLTKDQIDELHRLQVAILRNALAQLAPGGTLVYSTCSMEPEENELVVEEALQIAAKAGLNIGKSSSPPMLAPIASYLEPSIDPSRFLGSDGSFRTLPHRDGTDGFFAAVLEREK
jgi:16S rRNA (cytosine967-C5)-methyltransferase